MDALSDPNAAAKATAQRDDQMKSMGIQAADGKDAKGKGAAKKEEKKGMIFYFILFYYIIFIK